MKGKEASSSAAPPQRRRASCVGKRRTSAKKLAHMIVALASGETSMEELIPSSREKPDFWRKLNGKVKTIRFFKRTEEDEDDHEVDPIDYNNFDEEAARLALEHFNKDMEAKGGVLYELVATLQSSLLFEYGIWTHLNFRAKPKNSADTDAVLFFGEVQTLVEGVRIVRCYLLNSDDPLGTCIGCRNGVVHPPQGFRPGTGFPFDPLAA